MIYEPFNIDAAINKLNGDLDFILSYSDQLNRQKAAVNFHNDLMHIRPYIKAHGTKEQVDSFTSVLNRTLEKLFDIHETA